MQSTSSIERMPKPFLAAGEVFQIGKIEAGHFFSLSLWSRVASVDAALALAESGVCKPQGESAEAGAGAGKAEPRSADCPCERADGAAPLSIDRVKRWTLKREGSTPNGGRRGKRLRSTRARSAWPTRPVSYRKAPYNSLIRGILSYRRRFYNS